MIKKVYPRLCEINLVRDAVSRTLAEYLTTILDLQTSEGRADLQVISSVPDPHTLTHQGSMAT